MQLAGIFLLLGLLALWTFRVVSVPPPLRNLFEEDEAIATAVVPLTEAEQFQKDLSRLPAPPENHAPQVAELIARLGELQAIPPILVAAVKRDRETPKDQTPAQWSEAELAVLRTYQAKFREAWEPFLSGPPPDWERFPDSAILFRSRNFLMGPGGGPVEYAFLKLGVAVDQEPIDSDEFIFFLRLLRQCSAIGALRHGYSGEGSFNFSGWALTDTVAQIQHINNKLERNDFLFGWNDARRLQISSFAPNPPTIATLRQSLKTERAVFKRSAEYLQSLPMGTSAEAALTRLLGDKEDADWFVSHVGKPKTAQNLAVILQQGADQIGSLEEKTFLSGPAWRQWLQGDLKNGINPALRGTMKGIQEFEQTSLKYQVALAFVNAASAYRQSGVEGLRKIPDPAQPGSFLNVSTSANEITLSSAFQENPGRNYSFTFETIPTP